VRSSLLDLCAKCGSIEDAWRVSEKMPSEDVVSWTGMISEHLNCRQGHRALELFW
jgi:pentatricopeptide repeat protein